MHYPLTFELGRASFSAHLIFEILAFQAAAVVFYAERQRDKIPEKTRLIVVFAAAIGALIGSRVLAWFEHWDSLQLGWTWFQYYNTKTIVGAIIGATLAIEITKRIIGEKRSTGDRFVMPLIVGIFVGRIGCMLTGVADHTAGLETNLPWGMDQGDGLHRHPTAIYEMLFLLIIGVWLMSMRHRWQKTSGLLFAVFLTAYLSFRFLIDFLKPSPELIGGISAIQWACLFMLLFYCAPRLFKLKSCSEVTPTTTSH